MPIALHVVTPSAEVLNVSVEEIVVPGAHGELGILPGHIPVVTALKPGVLTTIDRNGQRGLFVLGFGFAEVDADVATVLTSSFEPVDQVDLERAKRALGDAEEKLKTLGPEDPGYLEQTRRVARAQARIEGRSRAS